MAFLLLIFALALRFAAASVPSGVVRDSKFVFPFNSSQFPQQFRGIPFIGNKNLTFEIGHDTLNAYFAIPVIEKNLVHEINLIPYNSLIQSNISDDSIHMQRLTLFKNTRSSFYWKIENGTSKLNSYSIPSKRNIPGFNKDKVSIQFYISDIPQNNTIYVNEYVRIIPFQYNYIHGNYYYIPFNIFWYHTSISFTLKMGDGVKLAFYQEQYENPPRMKKWPLITPSTTSTSTSTTTTPSTIETSSPTTPTHTSTTTTDTPTPSTTSTLTTTTIISTTKLSSQITPEFEFSVFVQQNFDLLIVIAIVCALIIFCFMFSIFLCCCLRCF